MTSDVRRELSGVSEAKLYIYLILIYLIEVWLLYSVVLVSDVQQSDSVIHTYVSFFQILFPYRLL